jgi:ADP-ribosylglycohydrolase
MELEVVRACLFGVALGDALGAQTEFVRSAEEIRRRWPPMGPMEPAGYPVWRVTDDTQMMLAVGWAMKDLGGELEPGPFAERLRVRFVQWYHDPDNNRAPGNTCLRACDGLEALEDGQAWQDASVLGSKGCGANMRVQPLAFLDAEEEVIAGASQLQAAMTHGHPTGLAAAELTALAIRWSARGDDPDDLIEALRQRCAAQREVYHARWLGDLWERAHAPSPGEFISRGWDECDAALARAQEAVGVASLEDDPCLYAGDGWIAEEALATALLTYAQDYGSPLGVIRRGAVTRGDSDSIACIAGGLVGAYRGEGAWPTDWIDKVEYRDDLEDLAEFLAG